ncbi:MAG TPA: HEAT repeat domain-containing protein [Armatimonadota bacterium]|nr:HEAT repeat domain-containing protein [Armatimonadota bacterium]
MASLTRLIEDLSDWKWQVRVRAAAALGAMQDSRAVPPLVAALGDEQWEVREEAVKALVLMGEPAVQALCAALRQGDLRGRAAEVLGKIGEPAVVPLCAVLKGEDRAASLQAAITLGQIRDTRAVDDLGEALRAAIPMWDPRTGELFEGDRQLARAAVTVLGRIGGAGAVPPLCTALQGWDREVRAWAADALAAMAGRTPVPELRAAVPVLRRHVALWLLEPEPARLAYRRALQRIEAATASWKDLPLPSQPPPPAGSLPRPASPPAPHPGVLPIPAREAE